MARRIVVPAFQKAVIDFRACVNRTLRGVVFRDDDEDGQWDEGEPTLPEVHVFVSGIGDTFTDREGRFRLSDLPPGVHHLVIDRSSLGRTNENPRSVEFEVSPDGDPEPLAVPVTPVKRPVLRKTFPGT